MTEQKIINLTDKLNTRDGLAAAHAPKQSRGFRTEIICKNELGEVLFKESNSQLIGGANFVLEKVFGVQSSLNVDYLNDILGFGQTGTPVTETYPASTVVCLFGVGIGGAGDTSSSVYDVDVKDRELPQMIPFRVVTADNPLSELEKEKYWGKKTDGSKDSYYLKKFEGTPAVRTLWMDGLEGEDGSSVEPNVHESARTEGIESFVEIVLKIDKKDCRAFFENLGEIEKSRINSIGLFTGTKVTETDGSSEYKQVKLFSMLNIYNEMLGLSKELNLHYRVYSM